MCQSVENKEHSAVLFLFKYERIDKAKLGLSQLLFREMDKAKCLKFLVINDTTNHDPEMGDEPPSGEDYQRFAEEIKMSTKVDFVDAHFVITAKTMKEQVDLIASFLIQGGVKPTISPSLKTFNDLKTFVSNLVTDKDFKEAVLKERKEALTKSVVLRAAYSTLYVTGTTVAILGTITSAGVLSPFGAVLIGRAAYHAVRAGGKIITNKVKENDSTRAIIEREKVEIQEMCNTLKEAKEKFEELQKALE